VTATVIRLSEQPMPADRVAEFLAQDTHQIGRVHGWWAGEHILVATGDRIVAALVADEICRLHIGDSLLDVFKTPVVDDPVEAQLLGLPGDLVTFRPAPTTAARTVTLCRVRPAGDGGP
jgi:hypothetical protein